MGIRRWRDFIILIILIVKILSERKPSIRNVRAMTINEAIVIIRLSWKFRFDT